MMIKYCLLLSFLMAFYMVDIVGQQSAVSDFVSCVELKYGTDNLLVNGRPYLPVIQKSDDQHPYFQSAEWKPGLVYVNGNAYPANRLKYNLSTHQLIIKHERPNGTTQKVILSNLLVDSFRLERHLFVNQSLILPEKEKGGGYLELIFADRISLYRLQRKAFTASNNNGQSSGRFSSLKDAFYLFLEDKHFKITKKRELLACFPKHREAINQYLKDHSLHWKKITKPQLSQLLRFCNDQL